MSKSNNDISLEILPLGTPSPTQASPFGIDTSTPLKEAMYRATPPSWTTSPDKQILEPFTLGTKVIAKIGAGSGQLDSPFSVSAEAFASVAAEYAFAPALMQKMSAKKPSFEHHFSYADPDALAPTHLDIGLATYENDAFLMLLRYDIRADAVRSLVFIKEGDYLKYQPVMPAHLVKYFAEQADLLRRHPLLLVNVVLRFMQLGVHEFIRWRIAVNEMESLLGVTRYGNVLEKGGYQTVSYDHGLLNADLVGLAKKRADSERSATTILSHARSFHRLVALCEEAQAPPSSDSRASGRSSRLTSLQREEVQSTVTRAELYLTDTRATAAILASHNTALENRISRRESAAAKTLAVLGLIFIPAAFVSQVAQLLATGMFTEETTAGTSSASTAAAAAAGGGGGGGGESPLGSKRHFSSYGWLYVGISVLLTVVTVVVWVGWQHWGSRWLERVRMARIRRSNSVSPDGLYVKMANSRRGIGTGSYV